MVCKMGLSEAHLGLKIILLIPVVYIGKVIML